MRPLNGCLIGRVLRQRRVHDWPGDCHLQSPPQWPTAHLDMLPLFGNIIEGSTAISLHPSSQRFDGGAAMPLLFGSIIEKGPWPLLKSQTCFAGIGWLCSDSPSIGAHASQRQWIALDESTVCRITDYLHFANACEQTGIPMFSLGRREGVRGGGQWRRVRTVSEAKRRSEERGCLRVLVDVC